MMKLFKVECKTGQYEDKFYCFVIAGNDCEAKKIVEEEIFTLNGMTIVSACEEEMEEFPRLLCTCSEDDID